MQDLLKRGERLFSEGRVDEAEECFHDLIEVEPRHKEAFNNLGVIAFQRRQPERARDFLQNALRIDPGYGEALDNLARLSHEYPSPARYQEAEADYTGKLEGVRLALVNSWDNKFNKIYGEYFGKNNDVRVCRAGTGDEIRNLRDVLDWADIIWSTWANEPLVYLSSAPKRSLLVSNIRSLSLIHI